METMTFGILAFTVLIASGWCVFHKKRFLGIGGSITTMILTVLFGYCWRNMLIESGKDAFLLGFSSYPAVLVMLMLFLVCAVMMLVISAAALARK